MKKPYTGRPFHRKSNQPKRTTFGVVINEKAKNYSEEKVNLLIKELARSQSNWHIIKSNSKKEVIYQIRKFLSRQPAGIIACGGDGTVNLAARNLIRRTCVLGILPLGRFNNIYQSLYGQPDLNKAIEHIFSGQIRRIDYATANRYFFLGSVGIGLIPELMQSIGDGNPPRFGITWSHKASLAAASVVPKRTTITIDEFKFDVTPLIINLNILKYSAGLPISSASILDDGKAEVIFDIGSGQAILSGFIRKIFKGKYLYSDEIRMFRGRKIILSPVAERKLYLDGEIVTLSETDLAVEIFPNKIRVFQKHEE